MGMIKHRYDFSALLETFCVVTIDILQNNPLKDIFSYFIFDFSFCFYIFFLNIFLKHVKAVISHSF